MMMEVILLGVLDTAVTTACVAQPAGSDTPTGAIVAISGRDDLLKTWRTKSGHKLTVDSLS